MATQLEAIEAEVGSYVDDIERYGVQQTVLWGRVDAEAHDLLRQFDSEDGKGRVGTIATIGAAACAVIMVAGALNGGGPLSFLNPGNWFKGGSSDKAPHGAVVYGGQTADTASENLMIEVGKGTATVVVQAKQDWDKPGGIFDGDFQATNGTSFVRNPDDKGAPANLKYETRYCVDGLLQTTTKTDADGKEATTIDFQMDNIYVCDAVLKNTEDNNSSFVGDDTPAWFNGRFVTFIKGAAETTVKAAPCPTEELEKYMAKPYLDHVSEELASRRGLLPKDVTVEAPVTGMTDEKTQRELNKDLKAYANKKDPEHPKRSFAALDISFLSTEGRAVEDSCYKDAGGIDLDTIESAPIPNPKSKL